MLAEGLEAVAHAAGVEATAVARPGLVTLFFAPAPPRSYDEARACDLDAYAAFCRGMLDRGVYLPPSQFEAWFPSLAHTDAHVARTVDAAGEVLRSLA
jgi:glutamate-1-semialdehyde 2,1-aminomutase